MTNGSEILLQEALQNVMVIASGCHLGNGNETADGNSENSDTDPKNSGKSDGLSKDND
jgi:hypothetical protein